MMKQQVVVYVDSHKEDAYLKGLLFCKQKNIDIFLSRLVGEMFELWGSVDSDVFLLILDSSKLSDVYILPVPVKEPCFLSWLECELLGRFSNGDTSYYETLLHLREGNYATT
jgi:hypothetical protein